jgi:hypothetical protein
VELVINLNDRQGALGLDVPLFLRRRAEEAEEG